MHKLLSKIVLICLFTFFWTSQSNSWSSANSSDPVDVENMDMANWVDSVFNALSPDQRLGQLFMVAAYSNQGQDHVNQIANLVEQENLGGLIFFQGGPKRQARLTNYYQAKAKTPLLIAMDAEWGIGMRLDSIPDFPKAMTLGAIPDTQLIYEMGEEIARQFKELGMHINFAPVVDVNSNPDNPVIGYRSFGENPQAVAKRSVAYMKGMQDHGIIANAKHFPGHGDTEADSHYALPLIRHPENRIWEVDLYPYQELFKENLKSVMVAHLNIPSLGEIGNRPTSLSKKVVTELLQERMKFKGLIFTDALNMQGVTKSYSPGEVDVEALIAGNDVLLYSQNVPKAKAMINQAVAEGKIEQSEIDRRIKKILKSKYEVGLNQYRPIDTYRLVERIVTPTTHEILEKLYASAITVASNKADLIPFRQLDTKRFASLTIGGAGKEFQKGLDKYAKFEHFNIGKASSESEHYNLLKKLEDFDVIVLGVMGISNSPVGLWDSPGMWLCSESFSRDKKPSMCCLEMLTPVSFSKGSTTW
jgi:Beta-glucosidase-related glycosidases